MFPGEYVLFGNERSFFTRKLQAQLRFQNIPYRLELKSLNNRERIENRAGTHLIPVLGTPEGWYLWDSTPIGQFLDQRYPSCPVLPPSPVLRAACLLLEDWSDEWLTRFALHSRWCYPDNAAAVEPLMLANIVCGALEDETLNAEQHAQIDAAAGMIRDTFGRKACKAVAALEDQSALLHRQFGQLQKLLASHLERWPFLLGARACMADFSLTGGYRAHFLVDPEPRSWVDDSGFALVEYAERVWNTDSGECAPDWSETDEIIASLRTLFGDSVAHFHRALAANRRALESGDKSFVLDVGGGDQSFRARPYMELSRQHIANELRRDPAGLEEICASPLAPAVRAYLE